MQYTQAVHKIETPASQRQFKNICLQSHELPLCKVALGYFGSGTQIHAEHASTPTGSYLGESSHAERVGAYSNHIRGFHERRIDIRPAPELRFHALGSCRSCQYPRMPRPASLPFNSSGVKPVLQRKTASELRNSPSSNCVRAYRCHWKPKLSA